MDVHNLTKGHAALPGTTASLPTDVIKRAPETPRCEDCKTLMLLYDAGIRLADGATYYTWRCGGWIPFNGTHGCGKLKTIYTEDK